MKTIVAGALCFAAYGATLDAVTGGASIRHEVQQHGGFERMLVWTDAPYRLADLVGLADLVIEAVPIASRSYLESREMHIYTDYTFEIRTFLKNRLRPDLRVGRTATVRRQSGVVYVDGRPAVSIENGFPLFAGHQRYLLFLQETSEPGVYVVAAGPQGAYHVADRVTPLADGPFAWAAASREGLLNELRALVKFME